MGIVPRIAALLGVIALAACASPITAEKISALKASETTYDQVVAAFGQPTSELMISGGNKVALYFTPQYDGDLNKTIPYLNLFESKYSGDTYDFFIFNRDGVLQSYSIPQFSRIAKIPDAST